MCVYDHIVMLLQICKK